LEVSCGPRRALHNIRREGNRIFLREKSIVNEKSSTSALRRLASGQFSSWAEYIRLALGCITPDHGAIGSDY
jgi:hypothetical protein